MAISPPPIQENITDKEGKAPQTWLAWFGSVERNLSNILSSSPVWGGITGTLSDQTDLQTVLDTKLEAGDNVSVLTNDAGYITGYTETDTLQLVTDRGATTTNTITLSPSGNNQALIVNGSGSGTALNIDHAGSGTKLNITTTGSGDLINAGSFIVDNSGNASVPDEAYGVSWNGSLEVPTKNALYDKIETLGGNPTESIILAASDEATDLTTGTGVLTFRMPYAFTLTDVRASVTTAPTGATVTVDINESGTTILSTKLTIDVSEKTSTTAATPVVISDSNLADDAEITVDIDQVGSTVAGTGLKIALIGTRA